MTITKSTAPHIWLIDDDQSIRWVLEKTLKTQNYEVTSFESGSVALARFKRSTNHQLPDVILTDVRMPGINGFELLKQLSNSGIDIPVIIMTAYSDLDTTKQVFQEGAFAYLPKPFDIDDALDAVDRACRHHSKNNLPALVVAPTEDINWQDSLRRWAQAELANGEQNILKNASWSFEKVLLECALDKTRGRKQEAARLLGWGRNTLTRKLKELDAINPEPPTKD